ncbi:MAG: transcriptional regulator [Alphaproteobacteria bacterium]|nr:MAG: transcriptional regulator [Alphaproteobacteria bacterium]
MRPEPIDVAATVATLKALANPARLRIAMHLIDGEKAVSEIEDELGLKQPNLSQYLAELREAGLVTTRREARSVFYALADAQAKALLRALSGQPGKERCSASAVSVRTKRSNGPLAAAAFATVEHGLVGSVTGVDRAATSDGRNRAAPSGVVAAGTGRFRTSGAA